MNNRAGGKKAAATNKQNWGEDFYGRIGATGGKISRGGGFSGEEGRKRARIAGAKGGSLGRIKPKYEVPESVPCTYCNRKGHTAYDCPKRIDKLNPNRRILEKYSSKGIQS